MRFAPTICILLAGLSFACSGYSSASSTAAGAAPEPQLTTASLQSTNVHGTVLNGANNPVAFAAKYGIAKRHAGGGGVSIVLGSSGAPSCSNDSKDWGANSLINIDIPSEAKSGSEYRRTENDDGPSAFEDVTGSAAVANGFSTGPFYAATLYIYEIDATHVHGWLSGQDLQFTLNPGTPNSTSITGEFDIPFCDLK